MDTQDVAAFGRRREVDDERLVEPALPRELEQAVVAGLLRALHAGRPPDTEALLTEIGATVPLSRSRPEAIARACSLARDLVPAG